MAGPVAVYGPDFNPRTREGCDVDILQEGENLLQISIHAPVKGATCRGHPKGGPLVDFNPRTREGCDLLDQTKLPFEENFNPRTREGCDLVRDGG